MYYRYYSPAPAAPPPQPAAAPQPAAPPAPAIQHPIPSTAEQQQAPLPPLDQSDPVVRDSLTGLLGKPAVAKFLVPHEVIRDSWSPWTTCRARRSRRSCGHCSRPAGDTAVDTQAGQTTLSEQNYARYAPLMQVVSTADPKALAAIYFRLYPLFQQAYENLGYPGKYFNDRLVLAIDSMLATPDVAGADLRSSGRRCSISSRIRSSRRCRPGRNC